MDQRKMMGFDSPGDQKVPIRVGDWHAMKLALWRSKVAWGIVARAATSIVEGCRHADGCGGRDDETEPCTSDLYEAVAPLVAAPQMAGPPVVASPVMLRQGCPDRELRMSALVILNAARQFAPIDARAPANAPYYAPSREYFSDVLADLAAAQLSLSALQTAVREGRASAELDVEPFPLAPHAPAQLEEAPP